MDFNSIRYEMLEALVDKYPEEGRLHYMLALEEAASGDNKEAKEHLGEAAKYSDGSMKAEIIDLMCHLYSGKSFIPVLPTDRGKNIFFEMDKFSLHPTYTKDELDSIYELAEELTEDENNLDIDFEDDDEIYPRGLRLLTDNEF